MKISHEVPLCLLEKSKQFNDYDYCLLHLTYIYPEYKEFYINSVKEGREVLLDNSMYELGDALTNEQLAKGVMEIKPTWYVVPDCFNNKDITIQRFKSFIEEYPNLPGQKIGVVQGSTVDEMIECYKFMSKYADKIAIPFGSLSYLEIEKEGNELERKSIGRVKFIKLLMDKNIWNFDKKHHLLGCNLVKEFSDPIYKNKSIESLDTSNPIIFGIEGIKYKKNINFKPKTKMCDLMEIKIDKLYNNIIDYNIKKFKKGVIK